jgi:hypothetical protein
MSHRRDPASDPLLAHHRGLVAKVAAWKECWAHHNEAGGAALSALLSTRYLGEPLSMQVERRLLEARREIDNELARHAGVLAAAVALACRAGETDAIERRTQEAFLAIGKHDEAFESKMAELEPLVRYYTMLSTAVGPVPRG